MQDHLPKQELLENLYLEFVNRVNEVGVDVNKAIKQDYSGNLLQFVCGLGPRKNAFADELQRQGCGNKRITLYDIRAELSSPYKDLRSPYMSPTPEELFDILTKETPETFYIEKSNGEWGSQTDNSSENANGDTYDWKRMGHTGRNNRGGKSQSWS
ncbi:hypothetical protein PV328_012173, partial [Microctonus aethiopoides]